jgi:hypothetical protein
MGRNESQCLYQTGVVQKNGNKSVAEATLVLKTFGVLKCVLIEINLKNRKIPILKTIANRLEMYKLTQQ